MIVKVRGFEGTLQRLDLSDVIHTLDKPVAVFYDVQLHLDGVGSLSVDNVSEDEITIFNGGQPCDP